MKSKGLFSQYRLKRIPVMKNAYYWFIAPLAIVFIALICGLVYNAEGSKYGGFANVGIDFTGGTVLTVETKGIDMISGDNFDKNYDIIKGVLESKGVAASISQTGGSNTIIVRYKNTIVINGDPVDYNVPSKTEEMIAINKSITADVETAFKAKYGNDISIEANAEMTNATASKEFINKALLAVGVALLLMLIYILVRFDIYSSIAAVSAEFHDIIVMLGLVIIFRVEMSSSLIAGIITIITYCINNTIVILDRVRENVKPYKQNKSKLDTRAIVDDSVTECFKRTIFSNLMTLVTIVAVALTGVASLTQFALPIVFGLLAGMYSSNFIAPSIWGLMMQAKINGDRKARKTKTARAYR